ncbi:MAG: hypothetical protein ACR2Q3_01875 [Woeseiaceae bacterium]
MELLSLLTVAGFALSWQRWRDTTASSALLHAVSAMLVLLFVGALLNLLLPVAVLLLASGTMLSVTELVRIRRNRLAIPVPIGVLVVSGILYWLVHSGSSLFYYDEYSHWGVFLREMLASSALWGADTNSMHPRYLPGTSLWQYYFAVYSGRPEGAGYLAQFILLLTPLMVIWEKIAWRQVLWHIGLMALLIVLLFNFGHGFTSLYVDHLLGAWFAGILLNFLVDQKARSLAQLGSYLLPLAVLVLIKTTGVFFAIAVAGIIALLLIAPAENATRQSLSLRWLRAVAFPAVTLVLCISILSVWNLNRNALDVGDGAGEAASLMGSIVSGESVLTDAQQQELTRRFVEVLMHQQISKDIVSAQYNAFSYPIMGAFTERFRLTTFSLLGFSLIAIFLSWYVLLAKETRLAWLVASTSTWLAGVVYIGGLYLGYRYASKSDYDLLLSSYVRYSHSMLLPIALFCVSPLLPLFSGAQGQAVKLGENLFVERRFCFFAVGLVALYIFESPYLRPLYVEQPPHDFRIQTEPVTDRMRELTGNSTLWVFFPNDVENGALGQMLQYQLSPGRAHVEENSDRLLNDLDALRKELRNWEYIWFANKNPEFQNAIESLLGQGLGDGLFRINPVGDRLQFVEVDNALGASSH